MSDNASKALLNERQVSRLLGVTVAAVRRWRWQRRGPTYLKVEGAVRYRLDDIERYLAGRTFDPLRQVGQSSESQ